MLLTIKLAISNAFVVVEKSKAILVDAGGPHDATKLVEVLARHGLRPENLSLILFTHGHWDHCGSARQFKEWAPKTPIAIHKGDAAKLRSGSNGTLRPTCLTGWILRKLLNISYPGIEPDIEFQGELDLQEFGVQGRVLSTPGHTAGSISVVLPEEIIVGDLLMGGFLGGKLRPRRPGLHYFADNVSESRRSLEKLLMLGSEVIHVGHGGPLAAAAVKKRFKIEV